MLVATLGPESACSGRTIDFEGGRFLHELLGEVSADDIMDYDRRGWLTWPMDGMRAWVGSLASPSEPSPPQGQLHDASVPRGSAVNPLPWSSTCPACRGSALVAGEPKTSLFGGASRAVWQCPRCGAQFTRTNDPEETRFELKKAGSAGARIVKRFAKQGLTPEEWARVAAGGSSDGEIASIDLENFLMALRNGTTTFRMDDREAPIALKRGECVAFCSPDVVLREPRRVTQGVYGGPRVRLAKSLSVNLGAFRAAPHEELHDIDRGQLVVTTTRYVFVGEKRNVSARLGLIDSIEPYTDAVAIHRSNKQRVEIFCNLDRHGFSFEWEGRTHMASLTGRVVACALQGIVSAADASRPAGTRREIRGEAAPESSSDLVDELERLARLRDSGGLSDEEFTRLKARLIG